MVEDLYELLENEHRDIQKLFKILLGNNEPSKFPEIEKKLCLHMKSEEEFLYPPLEEVDKITILEGYEEHKIAKRLIKEIKIGSSFDELQFAKTKVLNELIDHHIKDEERDIFNIARKTLNKAQEDEILSKFKEAKFKEIDKKMSS